MKDISLCTIQELEDIGYLAIIIDPKDVPTSECFNIGVAHEAMLRAYDFYVDNLEVNND